jgi:transcription elongation factor Elf1
MGKDKNIELPANEPLILKNSTCPFCGEELNDKNSNKEHVIGRRFVPKCSLNQNWNLILNSCKNCNNKKSDLENDLSAITLYSGLWHDQGDETKEVISEAKRKANGSFSRRTKKPVAESQEEFKVKTTFGEANISFGFTSAPQLDNNRLFSLSLMQLMAFFYFITYDKKLRKGFCWKGAYMPVHVAQKNDWGNVIQTSFMNAVIDWKLRWHGITADCFYKSVIRKHPREDCWSWAIEFNKGYRAIGFLGNEDVAKEIYQSFEQPKKNTLVKSEKETVNYIKENRLGESVDIMFEIDHKCITSNSMGHRRRT